MPTIKVSNVPSVTLCEGFDSRLIHGAEMTWSFVSSKAGYTLPSHSHHHEQVTHILQGEFELTIDGIVHQLKQGDIVVIPSNAIHAGKSITDCEIIDVFHPVREDYKQKQTI